MKRNFKEEEIKLNEIFSSNRLFEFVEKAQKERDEEEKKIMIETLTETLKGRQIVFEDCLKKEWHY